MSLHILANIICDVCGIWLRETVTEVTNDNGMTWIIDTTAPGGVVYGVNPTFFQTIPFAEQPRMVPLETRAWWNTPRG